MSFNKGDKRTIRAWAFYDWANSVYSLVISTAIFPIYYSAVTSTEESSRIMVFGTDWENSVIYSYTLSISFLIVAALSPFLSGIADTTNSKKKFLEGFCYLGALSCMGLYFFTSETIVLGLVLTMLASIGFWGSVVFYNAFLPEIAYPEQQDKASAQGFSMGYLGASLLLIFILVMITFHEQFGIASAGMATRISFLLVGVWWIGFAQLTLRRLPDKVYFSQDSDEVLPTGYRAIRRVFNQVRKHKGLSNFLLYFFCVSVGVQTIIYVASLFGEKILHLPSEKLIITILIIQFLGIAGSYLFAFLSGKMGNLKALILAALIWFGIAMAAGFMNGEAASAEKLFYFLAALVGMVLGGIQALSRSTYSKMIPKEATEHAGYFSFYDVTEKVAIVFGTFLYGFVESVTGSMQNSALALGVFFLFGVLVLWRQSFIQSKHTDPV